MQGICYPTGPQHKHHDSPLSHPISVASRAAKDLQSAIPVSGALQSIAPSLPLATLLKTLAPLILLIRLIDDAHFALLD